MAHAHPPTATELADPNRVKVILDDRGFVTDYLRKVPASAASRCRLQLGAYGYTADYLRRYAALPVSPRELELSHEMLRDPALAPLRAHPSAPGAPVDVPADLEYARRRLLERPQPQGVSA